MEKNIKINSVDYDTLRSNRFLVKIDSKKLEIEDWLISSVKFDDVDKKILTIIINDVYNSDTKEYKLMSEIDKCMNDYTIVKDITVSYLNTEGCVVYSEIFEECKVDTYRSSNLDYRENIGAHEIIINFRFRSHKVKVNGTAD